MLPLGILPDKRMNVTAFWDMGLTSPGVYTNHVMVYIVDDIDFML